MLPSDSSNKRRGSIVLRRINDLWVLLLVAFFAYTFINKVLQLESFKLNIARTAVFHGLWVDIVAYTALVAEAASILLLIFVRRWGQLFSLAMMLGFTGYILYLSATNRYEVCGCGGVLNGLHFRWHLLINLAIVFLLFLSIIYQRYHYSKK